MEAKPIIVVTLISELRWVMSADTALHAILMPNSFHLVSSDSWVRASRAAYPYFDLRVSVAVRMFSAISHSLHCWRLWITAATSVPKYGAWADRILAI